METNEINVPMFTYFDIYVLNNNIDFSFGEVKMFQQGQIWKTTTNKIVVSNYRPLEEIMIKIQTT